MDTEGTIVFVEDSSGPKGYTAVFEATDGLEKDTPPGGYLYLYDNLKSQIVRSLAIYTQVAREVREDDVQLFWSSDSSKCGVAIWGRMRGIIDITNDRELALPLGSPEDQAITDSAWLDGFDCYLDREQFVRARQAFWKDQARKQDPHVQNRPASETPVDTNFVLYKKGPNRLFGVFEDDGETGYLYVFDVAKDHILQTVQTYDSSPDLTVSAEDIRVLWSEDGNKCGVVIWNKMRGVIDLKKEKSGRVKLQSRESPGIADVNWLEGF